MTFTRAAPHAAPAQAGGDGARDAGGAVDATDAAPTGERSTFTKALTATVLLGGVGKGVIIDRVRTLAAFEHARANGKTTKWAAELLTGKITNDVVPITGGTIRLAGRTLSTTGWSQSYRASNAVGLALLGVGMIYGAPNLIEGWRDGGGTIDGLLETRQGRTGVFASLGNTLSLGVLGAAFLRAPAGSGRVAAMLNSPMLSSGKVVLAGIAASVPVTINELGYMDFLDRGATSSPLGNLHATTARHGARFRG